MKKRIAKLTSGILNPFLVSTAIIWLISFAATSSTVDAIKWALISMALSVLPVFLALIYLTRSGKLDSIFTNVRRQRTKAYLLASLCALAGFIVLYYLRAPSLLVAVFTAGLSAIVIFMGINLWWKISVHTAFIAASVAVLVVLYGWMAAIAVALVPLIAWARIEQKHHSLAQTAAGALLAALVVVLVFYFFALA